MHNKHISRLLEPGFRVYFTVSLLFAAISASFNPWVAVGEILLVFSLYLLLRSGIARRKREMIQYIESMSSNLETASRGTMVNSPLPVVIFRPDTDDIIWSNDKFLVLTGDRDHLFDTKLTSVVPSFETRWLMAGRSMCPSLVTVGEKEYQVFGNLVQTNSEGDGYLAITYWVDVTAYAHIEEEFLSSRPIAAILLLDNYEDLMRGLEESARSVLLSEINKRISQWADPAGGLLLRYDRDHYLFIFEARQYSTLNKKKFNILDSVREVQSPNGITATLSVGVGMEGSSLKELYHFAMLAIEMALSRGGDQAVVKDSNNFQFYGGKAKEAERRTKVKSRVMANALSELLVHADHVLIMGHKYPDLDVAGAAVGIFAIARKRAVPAHIIRENTANPADVLNRKLLARPEYQTAFLSPDDAKILTGPDTLLVVVDTNRPEQVQSKELLEACGRIVVIDHHRRAASYISDAVLNFHDPYASSASELTAELVQYIMDPGELLRIEAEALMAGIVLDTKNFTMRTGGRTFEAAAFLRRAGADTSEVKKFFQNNLNETIMRYDIIEKANIYRDNIAIAEVDETVDRITAAQAADELLNISGIETSFVLFPEKGSVILSARSSNDTNVQVIVEKLGGGGNAATAGAQMENQTLQDAAAALKSAIDQYFDDV